MTKQRRFEFQAKPLMTQACIFPALWGELAPAYLTKPLLQDPSHTEAQTIGNRAAGLSILYSCLQATNILLCSTPVPSQCLWKPRLVYWTMLTLHSSLWFIAQGPIQSFCPCLSDIIWVWDWKLFSALIRAQHWACYRAPWALMVQKDSEYFGSFP